MDSAGPTCLVSLGSCRLLLLLPPRAYALSRDADRLHQEVAQLYGLARPRLELLAVLPLGLNNERVHTSIRSEMAEKRSEKSAETLSRFKQSCLIQERAKVVVPSRPEHGTLPERIFEIILSALFRLLQIMYLTVLRTTWYVLHSISRANKQGFKVYTNITQAQT